MGRSDMSSKQQLDQAELDRLRDLWERTTRGPWTSFVEGRDHTSGSSFIMTGSERDRGRDIEISGGTSEDQDFIAEAHEAIPRLLAEIGRLRRLVSG